MSEPTKPKKGLRYLSKRLCTVRLADLPVLGFCNLLQKAVEK